MSVKSFRLYITLLSLCFCRMVTEAQTIVFDGAPSHWEGSLRADRTDYNTHTVFVGAAYKF